MTDSDPIQAVAYGQSAGPGSSHLVGPPRKNATERPYGKGIPSGLGTLIMVY